MTYRADAQLIAQFRRTDLLRAFWDSTGEERRRAAAELRADFALEREELERNRAALMAAVVRHANTPAMSNDDPSQEPIDFVVNALVEIAEEKATTP